MSTHRTTTLQIFDPLIITIIAKAINTLIIIKKNLAYKWAIKISGNSSLRLRRDRERLSNCLTLTRAMCNYSQAAK